MLPTKMTKYFDMTDKIEIKYAIPSPFYYNTILLRWGKCLLAASRGKIVTSRGSL